ncbi:PGF-pre-PGF domain-containing protein, partial [Candidatus Woesearchaeota archaeon]
DFSSATDFQNTNATQHTFAASVSNGTNYTFYYLCRDLNGNVNSPAAEHFFSVAAAPSGPSISISHPSNGSALAVGTTWTWLNITTNESASCKFSSNSSFSFASEGTLMSSNSSNTGHYYNYSSLSNGQSYTIYYRCNNSMAAVSSPKKHVFSVAPDTSSPSISFISPTPSSGSTSTSSSVNIKVNISETANATLVFNGNSYVMKNSTGGTQGTTLNKTLSVSDGTYSYYVVAEDSAGNTATSSTRTLTIDTTAPVITFVSPSNGSTLSDGGNILLSVSTDEAANCTLTSRKLGTTTSTSDVVLTANSARTSFTKRFNSTADSSGFDNYFTVQCVDDYSHTSTSTTYFKINDTTAPSVTFVSPKSNSYVASSSVTLNITTSEPLGSVKKAKVDSGSYVSLSGSSYYYYTFTSLNDSKHTITVNVSDTKGNTASYSVSFTVDTQSPELEVVSPENKEKISDCTAVVFNLSLSEESECSYEWFEDVEDECRDDCQADYDECYNDSDTVDEKNACRDDRDACYDDCEEEKYESIDDDSLEEQDRDACYSCQDSCEESCDSDYDSCMDSADTSDEEDSCKDDYDSCVSDCDDSCEDECKWYYYASFSQCVDDGDYLVAFSCEDNAGNENKTNITFSVEDTVPPVILSLSPSGKVYSYSVTLSATTSEDAECRYSDSNEGFSSMKNSMSGSGTSHSASLSFSEPGEHTYYVSCNDTNGNVMSSANSTTFEVVPTENDYAYKKLGRLSAGEIPVSFDNSSDVPVRKVVLKLSAEVDSEIIEVEELPAKPDDVPAPSKKVYSYLDLRRKSPSSALESAEITFDVSTSWIVSEGISASDIVLKHFVDSSSSWEDLPTSKVSESAEFITYTAKTPSFSIFAISVKESEKSQASSSQSSSQDSKASAGTSDEGSANETPENETVLQPDLDQPLPEWPEMPSSGFSWLWTLVSVLGLVAAGGAVWVTFKGPFWKQPGSGGSGGSGAHSESTMPSSESSESRPSLSEEEEAISSYLASGMTLEQVRDLFVGNGWSPEDFDSLYASYFAKVSSSESSSESSSVGSSPESSQDSYSESLPDSSPEASPAASEPGSEPVSEPAPDLGAFIKQSIRAGLDTHDIVRQLLDAGWPKDAVLSEIRFLEEQKLSLEKFAEQQIQSGIPKEEIKNMLLSQGWPEEDIDDALKKF